jgi:hypothetical protein
MEDHHMVVRAEDKISSLQVLLGGLHTYFVWYKVASSQSWLAEPPGTTSETRTVSAVTLMRTSLAVGNFVSNPLESFGDDICPIYTAVGNDQKSSEEDKISH